MNGKNKKFKQRNKTKKNKTMDAFSNAFAWIVLAILWTGCISYFDSRYFSEHDKFYGKTAMMYVLSVASIFATIVFFISSWRKFRGTGPKSDKRTK